MYCSGTSPRNNLNGWPLYPVATAACPYSREYFTAKDLEMKTERGERYRQRQESNARLAALHAELAQVNQEINALLASEEQTDADRNL